jgi:hypothetical protein
LILAEKADGWWLREFLPPSVCNPANQANDRRALGTDSSGHAGAMSMGGEKDRSTP